MNKAVIAAAVALAVGVGMLAKSQAPEVARYLNVKKM
jgi:hypothetical protein